MEQAGHTCIGYAECDPMCTRCQKVTRQIKSEKHNHTICTECGKEKRQHARFSYEAIHNTKGEWTAYDISGIESGTIPAADVWCFGFPCTDISKVGPQEGLAGARSGLFYKTIELFKSQKEEDKPKYLFIENVKNLFSVNGGWDFARILISLEDVGINAEWELLNSREFGVPQNRERVYIVGHLRGKSGARVFPIRRSITTTPLPRTEGFKIINNTVQGYDYAGENDSINFAFPGSNTRRGRVGRGYFQTLDTQCSQAVLDKRRWRRITPREALRLQGFPDWAIDKAMEVNKDVQLYKQAGNAVTVPVIYEIAKRLV